jgi:probable F420-dependent oxidoreductase
MLVDGGISADLIKAPAAAAEVEALGYDGAWSSETNHDPFLPLLLAAEHTERLQIGTGIAVAFARNPMTVAQTANDIQSFSGGRFLLGLGSQIKPHITRRFSMEWSHPAPRMREFILAMRAIWATWNEGTKLDFKGEFYTHTLMTPFFDPGPNPYGPPKVFLAAVGEKMTEVAGEVADGMLVHGFTTESYLREVTLPAIERGLAKGGRDRGAFQLSLPAFVVTGRTEEELATAATATRRQIAFYGSTPAYKGVLEHHGWTDLGPQLNTLSKQGKWDEMGELISDEVLHAFATVGAPNEVGPDLLARYRGVIDRISFYTPYKSDPELWRSVVTDLRA